MKHKILYLAIAVYLTAAFSSCESSRDFRRASVGKRFPHDSDEPKDKGGPKDDGKDGKKKDKKKSKDQ